MYIIIYILLYNDIYNIIILYISFATAANTHSTEGFCDFMLYSAAHSCGDTCSKLRRLKQQIQPRVDEMKNILLLLNRSMQR